MKKILFVLALISLGLGLFGMGGSFPAQAQIPRPTVNPPSTPVPPTNPGGSGNSAVSSGVSAETCAGVSGAVINWGYGGQPGVALQLANGSWRLDQLSGGDGRYNFGGLGTGVGILKIETGAPSLKPMINNAAIRLTCNFATQAHIGVYSGLQRPTPPAHLTFIPEQLSLEAGATTPITLQVKNDLPDPISQVIITDLFPAGIGIQSVQTSAGTFEIFDGSLLTVTPGNIPAGGSATITITIRAANTLPTGQLLSNSATLFYAESVADQARLLISAGEEISLTATAPATTTSVAATSLPTGTPLPTAMPVITVTSAPTETTALSATPVPTLPVATPVTTTSIKEGPATTALTATNGAQRVHIIKEGEILYDLAPMYNTSYQEIMALNNITDPRKLKIGQEILIPGPATPNQATGKVTVSDESAAPTPDILPVTGLGLSFSFVGLIVGIIALISRGIHGIGRRNE